MYRNSPGPWPIVYSLRVNESCDTWKNYITHMNESYHTNEWIMSHIRTSHATHSRHGLSFIPCVWTSHVTHMNESCHTYEWIMSHICMSPINHMNASCHTNKWVMPRIPVRHGLSFYFIFIPLGHGLSFIPCVWMSDGTQMNESWHTYELVMSHKQISPATHENGSCHTFTWAMAYLLFFNSPGPWPIVYSLHVNESCLTFERIMSHIWMSRITHMNESCHTYEWVMSHIPVCHGLSCIPCV